VKKNTLESTLKGNSQSPRAVPHHVVIKDDSLTTRIRVVHDASCKTCNGRSLNDILCTGPALQNYLGGVILDWHLHRVPRHPSRRFESYIRLRPTSANAILWSSMSLKKKSMLATFKQGTRPSTEL